MSQNLEANELRRQLRAHIESLRAAGVEWLPLGPPISVTCAAEPVPSSVTVITAPLNAEDGSLKTDSSKVAPLVPEPGVEQRKQALALLAQEVAKCTSCPSLASTRTQIVFGQGKPGVEICFVGEAPGADEDAQGLAFVGAAGQLLTKILQACGLTREEVYICNTIKCRPPGNRTPLPNEAANCRGFLDRQIDLVGPKYIVALGGCAATNLLSTTSSLGRLRGRFHDFRGIPVMVTYHPAYLLPHRNPEKKREVWQDMRWLMKQMGRELPDKVTS